MFNPSKPCRNKIPHLKQTLCCNTSDVHVTNTTKWGVYRVYFFVKMFFRQVKDTKLVTVQGEGSLLLGGVHVRFIHVSQGTELCM